MNTTTRNDLTPIAHFFLAPENPLHRQYEAFRHDPDKQLRFFQAVQHGPRYAPARDRIRELVVALRKRNLSVYDIQRELAQAGHTISINALAVLLREEGFA